MSTETPEVVEQEEVEAETPAIEGEAAEAEEADDLVVALDGEVDEDAEADAAIEALAPPGSPQNAAWARLRTERKRLKQENQQLRQAQTQAPAVQVEDVGTEPNPDDYEMFDDAGKAKFKADFSGWIDRKAKADTRAREQRETQEKQQRDWQGIVDGYERDKKSLRVRDFDDAETTVKGMFNVMQQSLLIKAPKQRAELVYALGKNSGAAQKLANIKDPIDFVWAAADIMHNKLKVTNTKSAPVPDRPLRSGVAGASPMNDTLDKLREEAMKTGDLSKLHAHKAEKRAK